MTKAANEPNLALTTSSLPDRSTPDNRTARRAVKRSLGLFVSVLDYAPAGTPDWTTAINDALLDVGANADKRLHLPAGNYVVSGVLNMAYPVDFFGDGMSLSVIKPTHLGTGLFITGEFGTGPRVRDLTIGFDTAGATSVAHIQVTNYQNVGSPTTQYSPDFLSLENLNLTGYSSSKAQYNVLVNGSSRVNTVGGTVAIGIRSIAMKRIVGFNATFRALELNHVRSGWYGDINLYGGSGGVGGAAVIAPSGVLSYDNKFFGGSINGTFAVADCDGTGLYGVTTTVSLGANVTNYVKY